MMTKQSAKVFTNILEHPKRRVLVLGIALALVFAVIYVLALPPGIGAQNSRTLNLASLSVTDQNGASIDFGTFAASTTSYTASVASTVERVTVAATAELSPSAGVHVMLAPHDSWSRTGHQVHLNYGKNLIVIGVHSYSSVQEPLRVYTVEINRAGSAPQDAISYVSSSSLGRTTEGSTVPFLFTRTGDSSERLIVSVNVWRKDRVSIQERAQVEFPAGYSSVILNQDPPNDSLYKGNYYLGVTVVTGTGYQVLSYEGSARTWVWDDDYYKPTLASLSLKDQNNATVAFGQFDPDTTSYTGSVASDNYFVTVTPAKASAAWLQMDVLPPDSKPGISGHQVDLHHGDNLIAVLVRSASGSDRNVLGTYQLEINRAGSSSGVATSTASIHGLSSGKEGDTMPYLLTRNGDTSQSLTVPVNVTESGGDMVSEISKGRFDIEFRSGDAWAKIEVPTNSDQDWEEHSTITVGMVAGPGMSLALRQALLHQR